MDISNFTIGRPVRIKTTDDIYDSYISAITLSDENFVYFKSGNLRNTLLDKLKSNEQSVGNKLDVSGGNISGNLSIGGELQVGGLRSTSKSRFVGVIYEPHWFKIGTVNLGGQGQSIVFDCIGGDGQNGQPEQNTVFRMVLKQRLGRRTIAYWFYC